MVDKELIKELVPMKAVAEYYVGTLRKNRIPCPFHGGKDDNLAVYGTGFHCFVCGASGDQFTFVEKLMNCDFPTACKHLIKDFNLPIEDERIMTDKEREKSAIERDKRAKRSIIGRMTNYARNWKYGRLVSLYIDASKKAKALEPTPWQDPTDEWAEAISDMHYYEYALEEMGCGIP